MIIKKINVTRSLLDDIKRKQFRWHGHVQRMDEGRLPKRTMKWQPEVTKKSSNPKLTWMDRIRCMIIQKGLTEEDLDNWRFKVL